MKNLKSFSLLILAILLIIGCKESVNPETEAILEEAGTLHDASLEMSIEVKHLLEGTDTLLERVGALIPNLPDEAAQLDADGYITAILEAKEDYKLWETSLVEVPGHEHAHHEGEGHQHNHDHSMDKASPEEILQKQKELNNFIKNIKNRLVKAIEMASAL